MYAQNRTPLDWFDLSLTGGGGALRGRGGGRLRALQPERQTAPGVPDLDGLALQRLGDLDLQRIGLVPQLPSLCRTSVLSIAASFGATVPDASRRRRRRAGGRGPCGARSGTVSVVIDAGVVVALVVADERQEAARHHLERWLEAGEALHAPAVLPYEVANVLARLVFDGFIRIDEVTDIWQRRLPVQLVA